MAILSDYHLHTSFSADSDCPMEETVKSAISKGLTSICITEHMDQGFPASEDITCEDWIVNVDSYLYELLKLREKYQDRLKVNFGLELGLQTEVFRENALVAKAHEFDFIIGSIHLVNGIDPYYPIFFEGRTVKEALSEYFKTVITNIKQFNNFDVLGHLDYVIRYAPIPEEEYKPTDYMDYVDSIIEILLEKEKGLELNTSSFSKGRINPNPHSDILKRYKEMGGEIITIGSDAHNAEDVAAGFDKAESILKELGFKYYSTYENRIVSYHKL